MKKNVVSMLLAVVLLANVAGAAFAAPLEGVGEGFAKNVIYLIPDGMSQGGVTLARWVYNNGEPLHMDETVSGLMQTHNSDTIVADSAPAGTAMATGVKTQDKLIGIKPAVANLPGAFQPTEDEIYMPVASILEAAKLNGKKTGLIATSEIQHATPADYSSHAVHRNEYTNIGEQQVYQGIDVVLGGGLGYLGLDTSDEKKITSKYRVDGEDMIPVLEEMGYEIITTRDELLASTADKIWGGFAEKAMKRDLDKPAEEPSLAEMTQKAIDVLSQGENGFFLFVEGSQVDWAAHANDTVGIISEIKAFDDAFGVALDFAKADGNTVVIAATDHGNSGITIGNMATSSNYSTLPVEFFVQYLRKATVTEEKALSMINEDGSNLAEVFAALGIEDATEEEIASVLEAEEGGTALALARVVSERSGIGYSTLGHTGEDVAIYVYSPSAENTLSGLINNSELGQYAAKAFGISHCRAVRS